jgi:flagellar basal-body rod protein FlgF
MPVSGESGGAITIPPEARDISIAEDGTISSSVGQLGKLKVVRFDNPQDMKPVGNSMYETSQSPVPDPASKVHQGMLEGSNVNSVMEMTDMIEVLRRYQSMAQLLQNNHNMEIGMIQKLSEA